MKMEHVHCRFRTLKGVMVVYTIYPDGDIEAWSEKIVHCPGGFKRKQYRKPVTREIARDAVSRLDYGDSRIVEIKNKYY